MGRGCSSDQITINDGVWGGPCHLQPQPLHPLSAGERVPSREGEAGNGSSESVPVLLD